MIQNYLHLINEFPWTKIPMTFQMLFRKEKYIILSCSLVFSTENFMKICISLKKKRSQVYLSLIFGIFLKRDAFFLAAIGREAAAIPGL